MIEQLPTPRPGAVSLFEEELQRFLWRLPHRSPLVDLEPHARRCPPADGDPDDGSPAGGNPAGGNPAGGDPAVGEIAPRVAAGEAEAAVEARMASLAQLLEAGAGQLAVAAAAYREQCRQAAVQARALAAFAVHRPAAVLDRPDEQVGAAAAASRAGRPAVLTAVSEWAVDEAMVALGLSAAAAARLLAQSVTVVERLPATLAALEAGTVSWSHAVMLADVLAPLTDADTRAGGGGGAAGAGGRQDGAPAAGRGAAGGAARRRRGGWPGRSGTGRCGCSPERTAWRR